MSVTEVQRKCKLGAEVCNRAPPYTSHRMMKQLRLIAALAAAAAALAVPAPAGAASGVRYGILDDAWLLNGPGTLDDRLGQLDALGVELVRFNLRWDDIGRRRPAAATDPADPGYAWSAYDEVLKGLRAHGIPAVVGLVGTPKWANGGRGSNYAPSSSATFGQFATAAAHRYPWVKQWLVWNEPNQRRWLIPTSPATYTRTLLNPAYAAIHAAIPGAEVGGGVTAPRAATGGVSPVAWIRGMHAAHARLDAYAQNPYPLDPRRETPSRGGCASCPTITMATIGHLVSEVSRNFGSARIWLTEYGYQTNPPDRILGVSYALQARYLGEASARAYRTPRVDMLIHFLVRDEPDLARFQSGLETLSGTPKPAFAAFQLPLAELSRMGTRTRLWGQVRTRGAASYRLERLVGTAWRPLTPNRPAARIFTFTGTLPPGTQVRVVAGSVTSPPLVVS